MKRAGLIVTQVASDETVTDLTNKRKRLLGKNGYEIGKRKFRESEEDEWYLRVQNQHSEGLGRVADEWLHIRW